MPIRSVQPGADPDTSLLELKRAAERAYRKALGMGYKRVASIFGHAAKQIIETDNAAPFQHLGRLKRIPVTLHEFVNSKEFLGDVMEFWPKLKDDLRLMNPDVFAGEEPVNEALLGGATGTGKTFLSQGTNLYQLYLLTCFTEPQRNYRLQPAVPIVFMFQSVSQTITVRVVYQPFRTTFLSMPYTRKWVGWDKNRERELALEGNILIAPAMANLQAMVGQQIISGILDEVNFMQVIESSKQVAGPTGLGGRFDQAELTYTNITRRRKRSFLTKGYSIGCICVVSSTRYKGDFLDRRIDEVKANSERNILWMRRKQYEVAPQERYSGDRFPVLLGTDDYPTRVLESHEEEGIHYPAGAEVEMVPVEYRADFLRDPEGAQRDIIGLASNAIQPFIAQRDRIIDAVMSGEQMGLKPWVKKQDVSLQIDGMPQIDEDHLPKEPSIRRAPRFIHVDLSSSTDRCGIGIVRVLGRMAMVKEDGITEMLPAYAVEAAISIQPSPTHHIDPSEVRSWIMRLIQFYGLNVTSVSYDGYQSMESQMLLRKAGVRSQEISMDTTSEPYTVFRRALYDKRIMMVRSELLRFELAQLEYNAERDKIDHPKRGCFVGETMIRLVDGSPMRFDEMVGRDDLQVVTWDGVQPVAALAVKPRETMRTRHLVEVELDNGEVIRCTPDHRFLLRDGTYKEAQHLTEDDELRSFDS